MGELTTRVKAAMGIAADFTLFPREAHIVEHYERELIRGRMNLNTAYEQAIANIAGANGHPTKPQRTLKERT